MRCFLGREASAQGQSASRAPAKLSHPRTALGLARWDRVRRLLNWPRFGVWKGNPTRLEAGMSNGVTRFLELSLTSTAFSNPLRFQVEAGRTLLGAGAAVAARDYARRCPLHYAGSSAAMTRLLLDFGADPEAKARGGQLTARHRYDGAACTNEP